MKKTHRLTVRQSLWLSVALAVASTMLGAGALHGYYLYRDARYAERFRVQALAESYAAQVAPLLLTGERGKAATFVEEVPWHPGVCLLALVDGQHRPIASRGNDPLLRRYRTFIASTEPQGGGHSWHVPADNEQMLPELNLAAVPVEAAGASERLGTLVCAARPVLTDASSAVRAGKFFGGVFLMALTGGVLGFWWLRRSVIQPLTELRSQLANRVNDDKGRDLPTNRADEIGDLARTMAEMQASLKEWRGRATKLERTVSVRVAAETQKIARQLERAEKQVWTDSLTRLGNRRLLEDKFADIFRAQLEAGADLSIVMIDVDHFKMLNDSLGHQAGDDLLVFIGELLRQCLRDQDLAVRYGGDEFLLILPSVPFLDAKSIAERTIKMFAQQARMLPVELKPTMSAGIASLWEHRPANPDMLISQADQALYAAKGAGKSCVRVYTPRLQPVAHH